MRHSALSRSGIVAACAVAVLVGAGVSGCTPVTDDTTISSTPVPSGESESPTLSEDSGSTSSAVGIRVPECPELISDERARELSGDPGFMPIDDNAELLNYALEYGFGPVASNAFTQAKQSKHCVWGLPNSGAVVQIMVAELPEEERFTLEAALADSDFTSSESGGVVMYEHHTTQGISPLYRWYLFRDNIWVSNFSSVGGPAFGENALASVIAANTNQASDPE